MKPSINHKAQRRVGGFPTAGGGLFATSCNLCRSLLFMLSFLFSIQLQAQVVTLDSVLRTIDKQNPMLQEYDNKVKALNTYAEGSKSWMAPMVGVGTFMTPYPNQMLM